MSGEGLAAQGRSNGDRWVQDTGHAMDRDDLPADEAFLLQVMLDTLAYARERDYTGWDYFDGMSSRVLEGLPADNKWVNIAVQESIKRAPVNVRPLLLVEQRQNFKGTALFAMANETAYALTSGERYREESRALVDWLVDNKADGYAGFCGGHTHEMQQLDERRPANTPNVVPTSYGVKALLRAAEYDDEYGAVARSAASFVAEDLKYTEFDGGARIVYQPLFDGEFYTLNGGALGARIHVDLYEAFDDPVYLERAQKLLDYIATKQADIGGWKYRDPPSASHLSMDNHHNGFVLEAYQRYQEVVGDDRYSETIERALDFHREYLFDANGAPNWDETKAYPKDIHAATQGIIVFSKAGEFTFARKILDWVFANLYAGEGQFYYQKRRFYTKRFTLMRWCQAWMAYAISVYLEERHLDGGT
ncbi:MULTISPECIES: antibiotic ABC transporter permease [Haloarcula]|uniref:antibiotic ABC transporter permease n=1 Tax=Haloarcula TaxID=2237 RepID=UPI00300F7D01